MLYLNVLIRAASCLATVASAHALLFPQQSSYLVACGWNTIAWKSLPGDPNRITLMLINANKQILNGAYDLGNALVSNSSTTTGVNVYMVYVPCLSASDMYAVQFLNASSASGAATNALYTSPTFSIKAAGTTPHPASGQSAIPSQNQAPLDRPPAIIVPDSIEPVMEADGSTLPSWPPFDKNMSIYFHNKNGSTTSRITVYRAHVSAMAACLGVLIIMML